MKKQNIKIIGVLALAILFFVNIYLVSAETKALETKFCEDVGYYSVAKTNCPDKYISAEYALQTGISTPILYKYISYPERKQIIAENSVPEGAVQGRNSWSTNTYGGPCPPHGEHRYVFKLYALDITLNPTTSATKKDVEQAMKGHVLEQTELVGVYKRER